MARWLVVTLPAHHETSCAVLFFRLGGLLMSLCGAILIVSLCSLCYRGRRVGDKASSDGDAASPPKPGSRSLSADNNDCDENNIKAELGDVATPAAIRGVQEQQMPHRSPVWQRTILMGERCKRPTFSGLILYDEKGNPLPKGRSKE